jgi:hypothetical protein
MVDGVDGRGTVDPDLVEPGTVERQPVELQTVEVVCPHCKKPFEAKLIGSGAGERYRGFKCPHCKLFVPAARAVEDESLQP